MKPFNYSVDEFVEILDEIINFDNFVLEFKDHLLLYPFDSAYIVKLNDGLFRVNYRFRIEVGNFYSSFQPIYNDELLKIKTFYIDSLKKIESLS